MDAMLKNLLFGFYENELTNNILPFWMSRCEDRVHGGYFNCYNNEGTQRFGTDKYTWSQGRFVWMFSKLATLESDTFTSAQRREFLEMAGRGARFLMKHCLIAPGDWRCVFLTDEAGAPQHVDGWADLDMSIYADCFVICGLARYALAAQDPESYRFARRLYASARDRFLSGRFKTLPYPLGTGFRAHGVPMIFVNVSTELYAAAQMFEPADCPRLRAEMNLYAETVLRDFVDDRLVVHEIIRDSGEWEPSLLGQHANPGHTVEDMWFVREAAMILERPEMARQAARIARQALTIGWDAQYGGILHYASPQGGPPDADLGPYADEPTVRQVRDGWGDKLWWVHAEALYAALVFYFDTGDSEFLAWHRRIFTYTFSHFPNPDREVREWLQILCRDGSPQNKVVALPVKDPYHITRSLTLILELLHRQKNLAD